MSSPVVSGSDDSNEKENQEIDGVKKPKSKYVSRDPRRETLAESIVQETTDAEPAAGPSAREVSENSTPRPKKRQRVEKGQPLIANMFAKQQIKRRRSGSQETQSKKLASSSSINISEMKNELYGDEKAGEDPSMDKKPKRESESAKPQMKRVGVNPRCEICRQSLAEDEIKLYPGHPNGAMEEFVSLVDPRLSLFTGDETAVHASDERPQNKVTHFRYIVFEI